MIDFSSIQESEIAHPITPLLLLPYKLPVWRKRVTAAAMTEGEAAPPSYSQRFVDRSRPQQQCRASAIIGTATIHLSSIVLYLPFLTEQLMMYSNK